MLGGVGWNRTDDGEGVEPGGFGGAGILRQQGHVLGNADQAGERFGTFEVARHPNGIASESAQHAVSLEYDVLNRRRTGEGEFLRWVARLAASP